MTSKVDEVRRRRLRGRAIHRRAAKIAKSSDGASESSSLGSGRRNCGGPSKYAAFRLPLTTTVIGSRAADRLAAQRKLSKDNAVCDAQE